MYLKFILFGGNKLNIGIDLGGSHIGIGIVDDKGKIIEKFEKRLLAEDKVRIEEVVENYIVNAFLKWNDKYKIDKIGIAVPGTVSLGVIKRCVNLGLENYDLTANLSKYIKCPIKMANDCKCASLAECNFGSLKNYNRAVFLSLGTGIGGAVLINKKLLDCGIYPGCEFGHMVIKKDGLLCNCGKKGCFEKYASMKTFKNQIRQALNLDEKTSGEELLDIIKSNLKNEKINNIITEYIENLSIGISNLINIFEPEVVGLGGSFVYFSDILLERLKIELIGKHYLFNKRDKLDIIPAEFKNDAGIIGSTLISK